MGGQEGRKVGLHANGAHAGAAASVRDAEGLVEVEMADVGADLAGGREADLGVHVGAVHVDLAAVVVDDLADLGDALLVDAVGGRVGHHQGSQLVLVGLDLLLEVGAVDVALGVGPDGHDAHAGHHGGGGVGAVS